MTTEATVLKAEARSGTGTGAARALRRSGSIPGVVYGNGKPAMSVSVNQNDVVKAYTKGGFFSRLVTLDTGKEKILTLPRELQLHPLSDKPVHADFMRIDPKAKVKVRVKVRFHNSDQAPGLKRGGVLNIVRHTVELYCPAGHIPEALDADLTGMSIGDSMHISAIKLPADAKTVITGRDFTIATIAGRMQEEVEAAVAAAPAEGESAAAEGEVAAEGAAAKPDAKKEGKKEGK